MPLWAQESSPQTHTEEVRVVAKQASKTPVSFAGHYTGLIERQSEVNDDLGGYIEFTVTRGGVISGSLLMGGRKYPFRRALKVSSGGGNYFSAGITVKRPKMSSLRLTLNRTGGSVKIDDASDASAEIFTHRSQLLVGPRERGGYNIGLNRKTGLAEGFARFTARKNGRGNWVGRAGDGSTFTSSSGLSDGGDMKIALHARLAKDLGSLQGFMTVQRWNLDVDSTTADLPMDIFIKSQDAGSENVVLEKTAITAVGNHYDRVSTLTKFYGSSYYYSFSAKLVFFGLRGTFSPPLFTQSFQLLPPAKLKLPPVGEYNFNGVKIRILPATGLFSGKYVESSSGQNGNFFGLLISHNGTMPFNSRGFGQYLMPLSEEGPIHLGTVQLLDRVH